MIAMSKVCRGCSVEKPADEFPTLKTSTDGLRGKCKLCWNTQKSKWRRCDSSRLAKQQKYYAQNADRICVAANERQSKQYASSPEFRNKIRERNLRRTYGLSIAAYDSMLESQGFACSVCKSTNSGCPRKLNFSVDHCHQTGKTRGLLCHKCNVGLGAFRDNTGHLFEAIKYLVKHKHPRQESLPSHQPN